MASWNEENPSFNDRDFDEMKGRGLESSRIWLVWAAGEVCFGSCFAPVDGKN